MKTALITGIGGAVGSFLAERLLEDSHNVIGIVKRTTSLRHLEGKDVTLEHGDMTDISSLIAVIKKHKPSLIFHLAAQSDPQFSFKTPFTTYQTNVMGTLNLLEAVRQEASYYPRIVICGSSEYYGGVPQEEQPIVEDTPFYPRSPYSGSKAAQEAVAKQYAYTWGMDIVISRGFMHIGPRSGAQLAMPNFARQIAMIEKGKQPPVIKVGNLQSVRTWLDMRDAVDAYVLLAKHGEKGRSYNICGDVVMSMGDALNKLIALSDVPIAVEPDPSRFRPTDISLQIASDATFRNLTGWKPTISFDETLHDLLEYWRSQP